MRKLAITVENDRSAGRRKRLRSLAVLVGFACVCGGLDVVLMLAGR